MQELVWHDGVQIQIRGRQKKSSRGEIVSENYRLTVTGPKQNAQRVYNFAMNLIKASKPEYAIGRPENFIQVFQAVHFRSFGVHPVLECQHPDSQTRRDMEKCMHRCREGGHRAAQPDVLRTALQWSESWQCNCWMPMMCIPPYVTHSHNARGYASECEIFVDCRDLPNPEHPYFTTRYHKGESSFVIQRTHSTHVHITYVRT